MYRQDDDALSHFMGQSDYGGAPTEVGQQSLIGGQNTQTNVGLPQSSTANMMSLRPPTQPAPTQSRRPRQSEFKRDNSAGGSTRPGESGLPPRERPNIARPQTTSQPKDNKNYGSFLQGLGGEASSRPARTGGALDVKRTQSENRGRDSNLMDTKSTGFVRDRSSRRAREGENDSASNIDAMSVGSRR